MAGDYSVQRLLEQIGGVAGLIYSSLPIVVFVPVSSLAGLRTAILAALGTAGAVLVWRLIRHESTQPAISGFFGVAVCALIAYLTGESKGYFAFGIVMSGLWAAAFAVSILIRRPAVGYLWSWASGRDDTWRGVRRAVYAYDAATLVWTVVFGARFGVQAVLYQADQTGWLAVARIGMGWPLAGVAAVASWLAVRYAQRQLPTPTAAAGAEAEAEAA